MKNIALGISLTLAGCAANQPNLHKISSVHSLCVESLPREDSTAFMIFMSSLKLSPIPLNWSSSCEGKFLAGTVEWHFALGCKMNGSIDVALWNINDPVDSYRGELSKREIDSLGISSLRDLCWYH